MAGQVQLDGKKPDPLLAVETQRVRARAKPVLMAMWPSGVPDGTYPPVESLPDRSDAAKSVPFAFLLGQPTVVHDALLGSEARV
jgi:hypothetical protein